MSYDSNRNMLAFMSPSGTAPLTAITLSSASASNGEFIVHKQCDVHVLQFVVTTAVVGTTTAPTVVFSKRPTAGSSSGATVIGTLTIPTGTAAGTVIYKRVSPVNMVVGNSLEIAWTIAVGSPAGVGQASVICLEDPEVEAANSKMVASA